MKKPSSAPASVLEELRRSKFEKVKVAVTDLDGVLRGKYLHKSKFLSSDKPGFGFCNVIFGWDSADVCYDNGSYTGWHTGFPDAQVRVDLATARHVPWDGQVPFFLGDFETVDGQPLEICPRQLLKKVLARLAKDGLTAKTGLEFEWFNFRETPQTLAAKDHRSPEPLTPGMFGYSILRSGQNQPYFAALMDELPAFGVPLEGLHTETGPGVFEAALLYSGALESADRAVLFKSAAREIGARFGIMASFMAKWNSQLPGCSGHTHQSLWNAAEENVFYDAKDPQGLSKTFRHFIAGQLACLPEILPLFAPTVNSYKRLVDGFWAPTKATWGLDNRTTALRVIRGGKNATRLETRVPGSDINPYLAVAACLASGFYGIQHKLPLKDAPVEGSAYMAKHIPRLPRTLQEATGAMAQSKLARELFGPVFVDHFVKTREWEWRQFQDSVTDWELKRYFEII